MIDWKKIEANSLSTWAVFGTQTKGRKFSEPEHRFRSPFHRDRDRILHCAAFRRLKYKTQVFIFHEGDYYRTRLTHTLEVAQIARTIAIALGLNETLTEALALAHDLGHTPFGHAGEDILDKLMREEGGFEHNIQSFRIVEYLEVRYKDFAGLNLCWETREGIIKHSKRFNQFKEFCDEFGDCPPSLEAQVVEIADEIAYDSHDLDDALASELITLDELNCIDIWKELVSQIKGQGITSKEMIRHYAVRTLIDIWVTDAINTLQSWLERNKITCSEDIRKQGGRAQFFSDQVNKSRSQVRSFLTANVYNHYRVKRMAIKYQRILERLFEVYVAQPELLPPHYYRQVDTYGIKRVVCDYIAGMTDRYAINEYKKIFDPYEKI